MDEPMKWDTAGKDLHNFIKEAGIVTAKQEGRREVQYQARQEAVQPDESGNGGRPAVPEQPHVPGIPEINPTTFEPLGIQMTRDIITKHSNPIMQCAILMTEMPSTNYDDWRTWGLALKEQSQRCEWGPKYTWEVAALDALLYQCPDDHWRKKILAGKWDFQMALDYGIRELQTKKTGQALGGNGNGNNAKKDEESINRVGDQAKEKFCRNCVSRHLKDKCPAKNNICVVCKGKGHYARSWECPRHEKHGQQSGNQKGNGRQQHNSGRVRDSGASRNKGNQASGGNSNTTTKTIFQRVGNTNQYVRKKRTETVNYVDEPYTDDEDEYSEGDFEYDMGRLEGLNKLGDQHDPTFVPAVLNKPIFGEGILVFC